MKNIDILKNMKSKLLATGIAATLVTSGTAITASATTTAQDLMNDLINGKQVNLSQDEISTYFEPIKQAVLNNGANLLPEDVENLYNKLKNNTSKDRERDQVELAMSIDYLLDTGMCSTYPQALQIENVTNYTCRELKKMGYDQIPSVFMTQATGEQNLIELNVIEQKAYDNKQLRETSYITINAIDRGYYDDKCYNIPDDNPATGIDYTAEITMLASEAALIGLTMKRKKEEKEKQLVKTR